MCGMVVCIMTGCTITGRISRKQTNAVIEHSNKQQREAMLEAEQAEQQEFKKGYIELVRPDAPTQYILPAVITPEGEKVATIDIPEVTVVAKSRSLPERMGKVNIDFVVTLPKELMGNCRGVGVVPMLHNANGDVLLEEISIRGALFSKVQERNYWQYDRYNDLFKPDEQGRQWAYERFIHYPYPEGTRLDSVLTDRSTISYFYTQEVETKEAGNQLLITLGGIVKALDRSEYCFPLSDTLDYNISSMLTFVDTTTRYVTRVVEKYVEVNDRNYLHFGLGRTDICDTLRDNSQQLARIENLMDEILNQKEFYVDNITLTATASLDGTIRTNEGMSKSRAHSLRDYLVKRFPKQGLDTLISVNWIGEDWEELERLLSEGEGAKMTNRAFIKGMIRDREGKDLDELDNKIRRQFPDDYKILLAEVYPKLRAVNFKYDLRRVGMVKDTVHTTVPDTLYARGVELMKSRKYAEALTVLEGFYDRNTAICMLSLGLDERAYNTLKIQPQHYTHEYLMAIACSRLGRKEKALEHFGKAVELNKFMRNRGELDPEIAPLIKDNNEKDD